MDHLTDTLKRVLSGQGRVCEGMGSPFSRVILELIAGPVEAVAAPLLAPWAEADVGKLVADATALRILGALHWLVLTGAEPGLAALYPPHASAADAAALEPVVRDVLRRRRAEIAAFMEGPPQTNEVRRCLALIGGFLTLAAELQKPLRCLEIGASAGLNQGWAKYGYTFGDGSRWGASQAAVQIEGDWRGPPPALGAAQVVETSACDVAPIDVRDPDQAMRLQAYIWADQADRLQRLRAAIAAAIKEDVRVERADAADWVARHLGPRPGVTTVLFHSVMWQYMPEATQAAVRAAIDRAGAAATPDAPTAWLRMEPPTTANPDMDVRLTVWPGGEERLLARSHPHGAWVEWLGAGAS